MKFLSTIFCLMLFASLFPVTLSASELDDIKKQQAQLEQMLKAIDQAEHERREHSQALEQLQKQLSCNWQLIQAYELCEQTYPQEPQAKLNCSNQAKAEAKRCLAK